MRSDCAEEEDPRRPPLGLRAKKPPTADQRQQRSECDRVTDAAVPEDGVWANLERYPELVEIREARQQ
jgi:hypothetical protein